MIRSRGRPKKFEEAEALQAAGQVFWANGFDGTSLDDLATAMDMNRPSIYRAFGDKESLYRRALGQFGARMEEGMYAAFSAKVDVRRALNNFYREAITVYTSGATAKGCFVMSTAATAAVSLPDVQLDLLGVVKSIDKGMGERFKRAIAEGDLPADFEVAARAAIAQSILHSLSLRARAGDSMASLNRLAKTGVDLVIS